MIFKAIKAREFAVLNMPIPAIVYEVPGLGLQIARVPVVPYGRPGTTALADNVMAAAKEADCFLMERHGAVAFDSVDLYEAFLKASYMENLRSYTSLH